MYKVVTDYIELEFLGSEVYEDGSIEYNFSVKALKSGDVWHMSYDKSCDMITSSMLMNQQVQGNGKETISKITGRTNSECSKDIEGVMEFYILEIIRFIVRILC